MYGLVLEAMFDAIRERHGDEILEEIRCSANIDQPDFNVHETYSEDVAHHLASAVSMSTGTRVNEVMTYFGFHFVHFTSRYGYDLMLKVLGRNLRDFLNGLDNLHDYLRMSYPKMCPPSFFSEKETKHGVIMHYRSKRKGYTHYVMGQIKKVALMFYNTELEIEIIEVDESSKGTHCVMKLHFDNRGYEMDMEQRLVRPKVPLEIKNKVFLNSFPYHIIFGRNMVVKSMGVGYKELIKDTQGKRVDHIFEMVKPPIEFTFEEVWAHTNIMFELNTISKLKKRAWRPSKDLVDAMEQCEEADNLFRDTFGNEDTATDGAKDQLLRLKGQMRYIKQWDCFMYLGTPILSSLKRMFDWGIYVNDLSLHDASRDYVMIGTHQSNELTKALSQQKQRTGRMEELMTLLRIERKRTDTLLYQMIPKEVARSLRRGDAAVNTCKAFDEVTIMFSEVVNFNKISAEITPMAIVALLNTMYVEFDALTERFQVYKVETINDVYMVAGGVPVETPFHAELVCHMARALLETVKSMKDPANPDSHIKVKIGMHSGSVVAGVVGMRMPRYCLFGDPVNTASRMESNGEGMKIHASEKVKPYLESAGFKLVRRGTIEVKGKGMMNTYWVTDYDGIDPADILNQLLVARERSGTLTSSEFNDDFGSTATYSDIQKSHLSMHSAMTGSSKVSVVPEKSEEKQKKDEALDNYERKYEQMVTQGGSKEFPTKRAQNSRKITGQVDVTACRSGTCVVQ